METWSQRWKGSEAGSAVTVAGRYGGKGVSELAMRLASLWLVNLQLFTPQNRGTGEVGVAIAKD